MLTSYLVGASTRKVKLALQPLVGGTALSRSSVSRLVKRRQGLFEAWRSRDLSQDGYVLVVLDAIRVPVRLARRVVKVPVQAAIGVTRPWRTRSSRERWLRSWVPSTRPIFWGSRTASARSEVLLRVDSGWPLRVEAQAQSKRMTRKLKELRSEARRRMHAPVAAQHRWLCRALRGHHAYYGLPSNYRAMWGYYEEVRRLWFRSLHRRSQRAHGWVWFAGLLERFPLPRPQITRPYDALVVRLG